MESRAELNIDLLINSSASHFSVVSFTQERVEQLEQLSKQPDIYERLAKALGKL